jgi:hypothetical protein
MTLTLFVGKVAKAVLLHNIDPKHNKTIAGFKDEMEKELDAYIEQSDMFGMNVLIAEAKDVE